MSKVAGQESLLAPFRALDLTDEKGLFCGKILADLGCDVIKIERPGGDLARSVGPFYHGVPDPEKSLFWFAYNTNKRGITLNLETADGREIFKKLVKTADFVVESFSPGYMDKIDLGFDTLTKLNPRLIMTSITPWGQTGPYSHYQCCDIVAMAMGGMMAITGDADRPPLVISLDHAYPLGGSHATIGTLMAHCFRQATGEGQHVDVSIIESVCRFAHGEAAFWQISKTLRRRQGREQLRMKAGLNLMSIFLCKDGEVAFRIMVGKLGRQMPLIVDWMKSEGYASPLEAVEDWNAIDTVEIDPGQIQKWQEIIAAFFLKHTKAEIFQQSLDRGIMLGRVNTLSELRTDAQLEAREFWTELKHPKLRAKITYPNMPYRFSNASCSVRRCAPAIGEHNEEIYLRELGVSRDELVYLKQANVI